MKKQNLYCSGLTLIELSIVLSIIGLVIGGVLVGQNLYKAAKLHQVSKDMNKYMAAVNNYKIIYSAYPGDHRTAEQFWPSKTNNGNGDGKIFDHWSTGAARDEDSKAMEQLSLAEIIEFHPTGSYSPQIVGKTMPAGPFDGQGYRFQSAPWNGNESLYGRMGMHIVAGIVAPGADVWDGFLTASQAYEVDKKFDDGMPATGLMISTGSTNSDCVEGSTGDWNPGNNKYAININRKACNLILWID